MPFAGKHRTKCELTFGFLDILTKIAIPLVSCPSPPLQPEQPDSCVCGKKAQAEVCGGARAHSCRVVSFLPFLAVPDGGPGGETLGKLKMPPDVI